MTDLTQFYNPDGPERCGVITSTGEVVELDNICPEPLQGFEISTEDLIAFSEMTECFWHTHPGTSSNLSMEDYQSMLMWPRQKHIIIGSDGVSTYRVIDGVLRRD